MKKKSFVFVALVFLLASCDNTFDQLSKISTPPVLYFNSNAKSINVTDSFKISLKTAAQHGINSPVYGFSVTGNDVGSTLTGVSFAITGGTGKLNAGGLELTNALTGIQPGIAMPLTFSTLQGGNYELSFTGKNGFGAATTATLNLFVFDNLAPVAKFVATASLTSKYDYVFDASASYDVDKDFGGSVKTYQYTITSNSYGTYQLTSDKPVTPLQLPGAGAFNVTLIVSDNDGATSSPYALPQPIQLQ